ncbi:MAG: Ig-like domain-containing protein, partial [Ruminococcus sp.]|nr:Ig-like domain-containing protein [Ruminococcus sp.]
TYELYDWAFATHTDNIYVDIEKSYASVEVGESIAVDATVVSASYDETPVISWYSSDENVATVDDNGVVYGVSSGRAKITARTTTGNFDTIYVSVGFYNGITLTSRDGDYTTGTKENVNWSAIKDSGFDFAVIRAGWGSEDYPNQNDAQFVNNVKGAAENEIPFYLSFVAYAQSKDEALAEADYFLREMNEYLPESGKDYLVSVLYNMTYDPYRYNSAELNTEIALAFAEKLKEHGYDTLVYANKAVLSNINTDELKNNNVGIYYRYYPYVVDFSNPPQLNGMTSDMWEYRSDGYFLPACEKGYATLCLSYNKPVPKSSTESDKRILGDVDNNGKVNIKDATMIQKAAADIITLSDAENLRADVNGDNKTNVKDATAIQKFIADIETSFPIGEKIS